MLIPAAGYGRRVGSPPAKELMAGPSGEPMILNALKAAARRCWPALVITRDDKLELIRFLQSLDSREYNVAVQTIGPSRDWPDTLLQSQPRWRAKNLVVLPDTEWAPESALDDLNFALNVSDVAFGSHCVKSQKTWGVLQAEGETLSLCEKPQISTGVSAWGLYGFRRDAGPSLLKAQSESTQDHRWRVLKLQATEIRLSTFRDLTRSK